MEKLVELFNKPEFMAKIENEGNLDVVYSMVLVEEPSVTRDEFDKFIIEVSKSMKLDESEITEDALEDVSGGSVLGALALAAGIKAAGDAISYCYKGGKAVGEAIYYATNKK